VHIQEKSTRNFKIQTPLYLPNGDRLGKLFCTILFKTLEFGGVGHLQIPKKKPKLGHMIGETGYYPSFNEVHSTYELLQ
jgi:hypothetical protein